MNDECEKSFAPSRRDNPGRVRAASAGAILLVAALAGCSSFSFDSQKPTVDPNVAPANYKASIMTFLEHNPFGLVGIREAALSPPELKSFGTDSRYVACMHAAGVDWRKEKMIVFFGGEINQFVDATTEACGTASYQPFPEVIALLNQLRGKR